MTETDHLKPLSKRFAAGSAVFIVGLGVTVLVGWFFHDPLLVQFVPQLPPMTRNAGLCFLLCGLALLMIALKRSRWLVIVCTGIVSIVSILTIVEYVFRVNAGIDELLGHPISASSSLARDAWRRFRRFVLPWVRLGCC